jgi:mono/diheme cytochrome c family protein
MRNDALKLKRHSPWWILALLVVALIVVAWAFSRVLNRSGDAAAQLSQPVTPTLIAQGAVLARAGDCVACHTSPGGKDFAGGLGIQSPIGTIYSTNITPDETTGIGKWTYGDFERALRRGIGHDGSALYPAMPFPSYAKITNADSEALYAYFMNAVAPVQQANQANGIAFPLSARWPLAYWRSLFSPTPQADKRPAMVSVDARIARGAYLVQGLGHCGSCHTPRALTMQEKGLDDSAPSYLGGAELNGWAVPPLRGMKHWSTEELVAYLATGRNSTASVAGEMKDVVANSTSYMSQEDLQAIAAYLKSIPSQDRPVASDLGARLDATIKKLTAATDLDLGQRLYLDNCGACHLVTGQGAPRTFPQLDGASIINSPNPTALIHVILAGAQTPSTAQAPSVLPMPGFAGRLDDSEVAALATFLRQGWGNDAPAVSNDQVGDVRKKLPVKKIGEVGLGANSAQ